MRCQHTHYLHEGFQQQWGSQKDADTYMIYRRMGTSERNKIANIWRHTLMFMCAPFPNHLANIQQILEDTSNEDTSLFTCSNYVRSFNLWVYILERSKPLILATLHLSTSGRFLIPQIFLFRFLNVFVPIPMTIIISVFIVIDKKLSP